TVEAGDNQGGTHAYSVVCGRGGPRMVNFKIVVDYCLAQLFRTKEKIDPGNSNRAKNTFSVTALASYKRNHCLKYFP
ncbi:hypothetical protein, partial [Rhizobium sp.]|uniref:hypothetical protein n=1 Tax=Rhizobium sp. TaxID=391 RepID=UPI0028AA0BE9